MSTAGWAQLVAFGLLLALSTRVLGAHMYRVYFTKRAPGDRVFLPVERTVYRACGIDPEGEQRWSSYVFSLLAFSLISCLFTYLLLRFQGHLPLNPDGMRSVGAGLSFNTAVSFLTGTNWQSYAGESTMSHLSQMAALVVQQFLAGAAGMAIAVALIRGLTRKRQTSLGSFWVDLVRSARGGTDVRLTATEWQVVGILARNPGKLITQRQLLEQVWGLTDTKTNYVRVFMVAIRKKLEPDPAYRRHFLTEPGSGLRFVPEGPRQQERSEHHA